MKNILEKIKFFSGDRKDSTGYYIIDIVDKYIKLSDDDWVILGGIERNYIKMLIIDEDGYSVQSYYHHHKQNMYDVNHAYFNNYLTTLINKRKRLLTIDKLIS